MDEEEKVYRGRQVYLYTYDQELGLQDLNPGA